MSIHLKEDTIPMAKKGKPGNVKLVKIGTKPSTFSEINEIAKEIRNKARRNPK